MYLAWYVGWESLSWGGLQGLSWPYWPLPWLGSSGSSSALHLGLEGPRPAHYSPVLLVQKGLTEHSQLNWRQCEPRECGNTSACLRVAALASPLGTHLLMSRLARSLSPPAPPSGWYKLAWRQGKCRKKVGHHLQGWTEKLGWWWHRRQISNEESLVGCRAGGRGCLDSSFAAWLHTPPVCCCSAALLVQPQMPDVHLHQTLGPGLAGHRLMQKCRVPEGGAPVPVKYWSSWWSL